ncbi:MAG: DNA polymerase IV [Phycisphaerae bacterium]
MERQIIHVDMDEFFAAVEKLDHPELRGKPLLVGGSADGRGVVSTASYEAREFGCHSAMPMATAIRLCPHAIVVPVHGRRYSEVSSQVFDIFGRYTPQIQPLSIDEAFLDVSGCRRLFGGPEQIARAIKNDIQGEIGITASVGVAPNKFLAKLASDLEKPDGLTVITPENLRAVLDPLPITKLWGVGPAAEKRFHRFNIRTVGQLAAMDDEQLRTYFGEDGLHFKRLACGQDSRPVTSDRSAKSIGNENTFAQDLEDPSDVRGVLLHQTEHVCHRLRRHGLQARTVTVKIRNGEFVTRTRSKTLDQPTDVTDEIWSAAVGLFDVWARRFEPVRLIGVTLSQMSRPGEGGQMSLFAAPADEKKKRLDRALDGILDKFGKTAVRRGGGNCREQ